MPKDLEILTPTQAAARIGRTRTVIMRAIQTGALRAIDMNPGGLRSRWVIAARDVDAFAGIDRQPGWKEGRPRGKRSE